MGGCMFFGREMDWWQMFPEAVVLRIIEREMDWVGVLLDISLWDWRMWLSVDLGKKKKWIMEASMVSMQKILQCGNLCHGVKYDSIDVIQELSVNFSSLVFSGKAYQKMH